MKIKIFKSSSTQGIEKEVNQFIEDKNVIDIKQSSCMPGTGASPFITTMVIYEE